MNASNSMYYIVIYGWYMYIMVISCIFVIELELIYIDYVNGYVIKLELIIDYPVLTHSIDVIAYLFLVYFFIPRPLHPGTRLITF